MCNDRHVYTVQVRQMCEEVYNHNSAVFGNGSMLWSDLDPRIAMLIVAVADDVVKRVVRGDVPAPSQEQKALLTKEMEAYGVLVDGGIR